MFSQASSNVNKTFVLQTNIKLFLQQIKDQYTYVVKTDQIKINYMEVLTYLA